MMFFFVRCEKLARCLILRVKSSYFAGERPDATGILQCFRNCFFYNIVLFFYHVGKVVHATKLGEGDVKAPGNASCWLPDHPDASPTSPGHSPTPARLLGLHALGLQVKLRGVALVWAPRGWGGG